MTLTLTLSLTPTLTDAQLQLGGARVEPREVQAAFEP
jgi:hypothetical protein